ncbi:MAG: AAA family ATPase [Desulfococcus multivorans]|jgi:chromosome partitioning protein|nr:AAA family ATPase [Desulfococcus multivorans]
MTQIICIANQKGGVGKTTTAVTLSAALALSEKRTLLIDCDPQANATTGLGIDKNDLTKTLYHGLIGEADAESLIIGSEIDNLSLLPSRVELIGFEVEMMNEREREHSLKKLIRSVADRYDYIIIDCPPSLSLLTLNAMAAADTLLIPLQCEFYALEGLGQLLQTKELINAGINPGLSILGILLTMLDKRTNLSHQVAEEAMKYFKGKERVFNTSIPRNVRLGEAPSFGKPILLYDAASMGAKSYLALAKEIIDG